MPQWCLCPGKYGSAELLFVVPVQQSPNFDHVYLYQYKVLGYGLTYKNNPKWGLVSIDKSPDGHLIRLYCHFQEGKRHDGVSGRVTKTARQRSLKDDADVIHMTLKRVRELVGDRAVEARGMKSNNRNSYGNLLLHPSKK
jgi:hypothetical protein